MNIVLLPGLDGTGVLAHRIHDALAQEHIVTTLAYPSHLYRYDDLQEWIEPLLPNDNFVIVAESFAGPLAAMIGAKNRPNLKGIVFVATFARRPRQLPVFLAHIIDFIPLKSTFLARLAQPFLMGKWTNPAFTDSFRQALSSVPAETLSRRLAEVLKADVVAELATINAPILYLRATKDWLVPTCMSQDFVMVSRGVCDIEGPHFLLQANADEAAAKIAGFTACLE